MSRKAFTLIELLVVIAIISLLAAILFPVFGRARENARRSSCLSNLRQVGLGIMQYTQDYDEYYPISNASGSGMGWAGRMMPYLKNSQVFVCPSDASKPGYGIKVSYAFNQNLNAPQGVFTPTKLSRLTASDKTVLLFEVSQGEAHATGNSISLTETGSPSGLGYFGSPANGALNATGELGGRAWASANCDDGPRHLEGANWLAADGHAKWLRGVAVSGGATPPGGENTMASATGGAAGTGSMKNAAGLQFQLTFSAA